MEDSVTSPLSWAAEEGQLHHYYSTLGPFLTVMGSHFVGDHPSFVDILIVKLTFVKFLIYLRLKNKDNMKSNFRKQLDFESTRFYGYTIICRLKMCYDFYQSNT